MKCNAKSKALIVGISNYSSSGRDNLPFCKNDIYAVNDALIKGLNMRQADIILCGETGRVTCEDFISGLQHLISISDDDDTIIVYFSGHGTTEKNEHYLIFSDTLVKTQQIIEVLEGIKAKSKILLLDCCFAGNFEVGGTAVFDISETADQFVGKGYAVVASCDAKQYSAGHSIMDTALTLQLDISHQMRQRQCTLQKIKSHKLENAYSIRTGVQYTVGIPPISESCRFVR